MFKVKRKNMYGVTVVLLVLIYKTVIATAESGIVSRVDCPTTDPVPTRYDFHKCELTWDWNGNDWYRCVLRQEPVFCKFWEGTTNN